MTKHRLADEYLAGVSRLDSRHPAAHRFLTRLQHEGPEVDLWLSTAVNAHLYLGDAFLVYLKLSSPELRSASLLLSPHFNQAIVEGTSDRSDVLFPKLIQKLVMASGGFAKRWAVLQPKGALELRTQTPDAFFDALFDTLCGLRRVLASASEASSS